MKISVVIPLYNESEHIQNLIVEVKKYKLPMIIVDDGSSYFDDSLLNKAKITYIKHVINLGKGAAMLTGAQFAFQNGSDAVVFMDADGQHSPKDLIKFIAKLRLNKYDVIFGTRNLRDGVPFVRYIGNKIASMVIKIFFGIYNSDPLSGFRAITKNAYEKVKWESSGYGVETEILVNAAKQKLNSTEIPIATIYHNKHKGVTILDAFAILADVLKWRLSP